MDFAMLKPFACVCFKVITSFKEFPSYYFMGWLEYRFWSITLVVTTPRNQVDYWLFRNSGSLCSLSKFLDTHRDQSFSYIHLSSLTLFQVLLDLFHYRIMNSLAIILWNTLAIHSDDFSSNHSLDLLTQVTWFVCKSVLLVTRVGLVGKFLMKLTLSE